MSEHKNLAEALAAFQAEVPTLRKDGDNPHFRSKYTPLDTIVETVTPILHEHGLQWSTFPCRDEQGEPALRYRLTHTPSSEVWQDVMPLMIVKADPQGLGSALTYARRYSMSSVLNLVSDEDDDGNSASRPRPDNPSKTRSQPPRDKLTAEDVEALKAAAKGLTGAQIKLALTACGIDTPKPFNAVEVLSTIPKPKVVLVAEALSEMERA